MEFVPFQKIARLSRDIVVTEKIDGTNAQVFIDFAANMEGLVPYDGVNKQTSPFLVIDEFVFGVGSRTQWITPMKDNHGFARWAFDHAKELLALGPGRHFGEWWGSGIQRGYGLVKGEKRFSLFNTGRWNAESPAPACCGVVPVLYQGPFTTDMVDTILEVLRDGGSMAAPGFMHPEGVVIYHVASGELFKKTLDDDAIPKSLADKARAGFGEEKNGKV